MSEPKYTLTVGLEIHAELKTRTKMFCDSKNDPDEKRPNVNVCPICMGHPGTLPVINKEAVRHVLKVGVAVNGTLADFTEFDRKNYFYPDIPKGYQISQYKFPLVSGGELCGVKITRVHLEEDTASSVHDEKTSSVIPENAGIQDDSLGPRLHGDDKAGYSLVDFNRAGVPLMELVTEPVIHLAKDAGDFARELQLLLRYLGVSDANMEKGEMRVEANISAIQDSRFKNGELGTKVEVKNLNSFRAVEKAIAYEYDRQVALLEEGGKVIQETRGWDETKQSTYSQRVKEDSHDYRYFPDPDLPKLVLSEIPEFALGILKKSLPELPSEKRARFIQTYDLKPEVAEVFLEDDFLRILFETVAKEAGNDKDLLRLSANYLSSDVTGLLRDSNVSGKQENLTTSGFLELMRMVKTNSVSSRGAKDILAEMYKNGGEPNAIAKEKGLFQKSDEGELKKIVQTVIDGNAKVVADYKAGKESALQFLVGQGMKATKGSANPEMLKTIIKTLIG